MAEIAAAAARRAAETYAEGLRDGMIITLRLLLGRPGPSGAGAPCPQPITAAAEQWALDALNAATKDTLIRDIGGL